MKVSVLLPYRNEAPYLPACLKSLANQTYRNFELLAVDDGSTDGSADILQAWARRFEKVKPISIPASGIVHALNHGLARAEGDVIARADGG